MLYPVRKICFYFCSSIRGADFSPICTVRYIRLLKLFYWSWTCNWPINNKSTVSWSFTDYWSGLFVALKACTWVDYPAAVEEERVAVNTYFIQAGHNSYDRSCLLKCWWFSKQSGHSHCSVPRLLLVWKCPIYKIPDVETMRETYLTIWSGFNMSIHHPNFINNSNSPETCWWAHISFSLIKDYEWGCNQ